jgi:ankyrin repeat protein
MVASKYGHVEAVKVLVEAGADFNAKDNVGHPSQLPPLVL